MLTHPRHHCVRLCVTAKRIFCSRQRANKRASMAEPKTKYDRQLRIWGEQGQTALEKASVCLLNCGPTGSETLKNLVLGGVGSITVIDGSKVEPGDLGNNFMVDESSVGKSKAKCVCQFLQELNDAVKAKFIEEYPEVLIETNPSFFSQFTLVVATQLGESSMVKLDRICREANVILIFARSYGLTGLVRISLKEHTVIESKPEHFLDDLRLNNPWPELKRYAETIDLDVSDPVAHKHTPYVLILVKMAEEWEKNHDGKLPSTREEKKEFKELIKARMTALDEDNYKEAIEASFKVFTPRGISSDLQQVIEDSCVEIESSSSDFWVMVAALKEFIENEGGGEAPLEGSIPDMTSSTEHYISLQKLYQAKAEADYLVIEQRVRTILKKIGRDPNSISKTTIKSLCKNARKLKVSVCRYRLVEDEFNSPTVPELQKYLTDEDYSVASVFYVLLRAVDRFAANYNSFPGQFDGLMDEDISRLKTTAVGLLNDVGCNGVTLTEDLINEMCRFGAAELHAVAAFIGGIASQEVIKVCVSSSASCVGSIGETRSACAEKGKKPSQVVMFVGLQGSGKTTTCTKYAYYHKNKGWKPALVCADTFRAGAFDQLKQNAAKAKVPFYGSYTETDPVKIAVEGVERFKNDQSNSFDLIIVDTSGRHKQEAALSEEMRQLSEAISPDLVVFVMDASIGQSAFHQAQAFKQSVAVGAVIVTKMDGHAKGGGTLSAVAATKSPVIFIGTGEHTDQLEAFDVKPFVRRLLGMGDLPGPANKIREAVPMDQHEDILENILQGGFTLRTMQVLFQTKLKLGTPSQLASMLPAECTSRLFPVGLGDDQENQNQMKQFLVMMDSMTAQELDSPNLKVSELRRQRIARGSGHEVRQVEELIEACKAVSKNFSKGRALLRSLNSGDMRAVTRNMSGNPQLLNQVGGMGGLRSLMNLGRL
ncbi:hypothetical protein DVH24_032331 [Malus domestica]|uniref:signal-recognition-particle GTPase n=1 Tax=Malus domestica TaxID=3750 RepID=A0A498J706_MALDO|nr:hypothetical protein DVH24_032331 [Malus domestica]